MAKVLGFIFAFIIVIPIFVIVGTFFSGVGAMIVGWAFPYVTDTIRELFAVNLTDFQIGATLGFFGSFFCAKNLAVKD